MPEYSDKQHICARMVDFLERKKITIGKWEAENGISNGYLRRSAKEGTNVGLDLIENFLSKFPEVDIEWLITGREATGKKSKKGTPVEKNEDLLAWVKPFAILKTQIESLRAQHSELEKRLRSLEKEKAV